MKHIGGMGTKITNQAKSIQENTCFISSDTDLKLFINENRTTTDVPLEVDLETLNLADEFNNYQ